MAQQQTIVGSEALTEILQDLKDEMPTLATEQSVRNIIDSYGKQQDQ